MFEKEERLLAEMKHETEKESMMVPDEALDSAIRSGIRAGSGDGRSGIAFALLLPWSSLPPQRCC